MSSAVVEWLGHLGIGVAGIEPSEGCQAPVTSPQDQTKGLVTVRLGQLFLNGKRLCSLANELVGPPHRESSSEVYLRLVGGRCISIAFQDLSAPQVAQAADRFYKDCKNSWVRAAGKQGKAASVARKLEEMLKASKEGRQSDGTRSRSRSPRNANSGGSVRPSRKRLLRRLSSIESEGVYRVQHAEDLSQERWELEESQEQHIVLEHMRRKALTREEFLQSLRKEAAMQVKILELNRAEQEEKERFDSLRTEVAQLHTSLHELENDETQAQVANPSTTSESLAASPAGGDACAALDAEVTLFDDVRARGSQAEQQRRSECVVCLNAVRCTVFLPCKHLVCCEECGHGPSMQKCPMCRAGIDWRFKVFL